MNKANMSDEQKMRIDSMVLHKLLAHLDSRKDVQNIDLMNLAGFCRNCLSKWHTAASVEMGFDTNYDESREYIYGMPYDDWKKNYQQPATEAQLAKFNQTK